MVPFSGKSIRGQQVMSKVKNDSFDWIQQVCDRFTTATGWPIKFMPVAPEELSDFASLNRDAPERCWSADIDDGKNKTGILYIDLPENPEDDRSFLAICEIAEIIASLLKKTATAKRLLDSRTQDVSTLADMGRSVSSEADIMAALKRLLQASIDLTDFRGAAFFLLNTEANELNLRVTEKIATEQIPVPVRQLSGAAVPDNHAFENGRSCLQRGPNPKHELWLPQGSSTAICVPVHSENGPLGTLWVYDRRLRSPEDREYHVLESIAAQLAGLLERIVLLKESEQTHRIQRDLDVASESQPSGVFTSLPTESGFEAAGVCTSAYELGGDLCELMKLDEHRSIIVVGDASGDSVPAAMIMSAARGAIRTLIDEEETGLLRTDQIVERLNRMLCKTTPDHQFMSMLFGILDSKKSCFTYTNAGHPTPILLQDDQMVTLESHGMLLGVMDDSNYSSSEIQLYPSDTLVFFSDGISEAMNRRRVMFRSDGIFGAISNYVERTAQEILNEIWKNLETHTDGSDHIDDRTLLVIKMASEKVKQ